MQESTAGVKRLLTAISQNATEHNITDLAQMLNYNEELLRQDIGTIREYLREQEKQETKGSYFLRKYILEHPEIRDGIFKFYDRYEYTGDVTGTGKVKAHVHVLSKDESIVARNRDELLVWTFKVKSPFDAFFKDPEENEEVIEKHIYRYDNYEKAGFDWDITPAFGSVPNREIPVFAYSEHGSLSFNTYDEFIREVKRELEREGHTDYYFCM